MGKAPVLSLSSELIRAARALLRWEQRDLSEASAISLPTIKRLGHSRAYWLHTRRQSLRSERRSKRQG